MRVRVDAALCSGHGRCYALAPDVFEADDDGYNAARGTVVEVAPGLEAAAERGAQNCPEQALTALPR